MYLSYFGLTEKPFNITPDPRFLFMSEQHREALAHLLFSTDESSSFIVLTGEVGTGKTTLCRSMLENGVDGNHFALILNPMQSPLELLASACDEFGITYPEKPGIKDLVDALNKWLLQLNARSEQAILVIDEAQNLSFETLEQIRLLTNLETGQKKLLKIILIGQPQLQDILQYPDLQQLSQRVTARFHLQPMNAAETNQYLRHRLGIAGARREIFSPKAVHRLFRLSSGIPRKINLIADRALMGAYARNRNTIDARLTERAAQEVSHSAFRNSHSRKYRSAILALSFLILLTMTAWLLMNTPTKTPSREQSLSQPPIPALDTQTYVDAINADLAEEAQQPPPPEPPAPPAPQPQNLSALPALFSLWGARLDAQSSVPACNQAMKDGINCLYQSDTLYGFLRLNRPAVIETTDEQGNAVQQLISNLEDGRFTIRTNREDATIDRGTLAAHWPGKFLTLWRAPPSGNTTVIPGSPQDDILWLWQQLQALALISPTEAAPDRFTNPLTQAIRQFQRDHGLQVDGIAGMRTLLALEQTIYPDSTPLLTKTRQGGSL